MSRAIPAIKEFPKDGRIWRLDWFGAVERNYDIPTEPYVQVVISPLRQGATDYASNNSVVHDDRKTILIGVGQLPLLSIGSLWQEGHCLLDRAGKTTTFERLEISTDTTQVVPASLVEEGQQLIPFNAHRIGGAGMGSKCIAISWKGDPYGVLIPISEIVRFYYATSTDLAHALFSGAFRHDLHSLINTAKSGYVEAENRCVLKLRQHLEDEDGWIIGRILNSEEAWHGATLLHDTLMKESANHRRVHMETTFPFAGATNLTVHYKPIMSMGRWRHLVFAIDRCTAPFPFKNLTILRDNDNNQADPSTDLPEDEKRLAFMQVAGSQSQIGKAQLQSQRAGSNTFLPVKLALPTDRFADIAGKVPDKPLKESCQYKSGDMKTFRPVTVDELSTGGGTGTEQNVARAKVVGSIARRSGLPQSFESFVSVIAELNKLPDVSAAVRSPADGTEFIPLLKPARTKQWSYLDSKTKARRRAIVADACASTANFCLIEFEWREGESYKLGLVGKTDATRLSNAELHEILLSLAKAEGCWENAKISTGIDVQTLKHTWPTAADCASSLRMRMRSHTPGLPESSH
ncbi:hypothetical protein [Ralstonia syzygii]|uniref:TnsE C-terminal domain-containing protein n=1 Tax=Ralstonia syzygii R24 TaxID=907261 RepID=G3A413_9RALS|nr:hypothetical protein [Ralstonia syzygii]CCA88636.1 conserved hypothetical protein [Ralstonia syzygii R24]